MTEKTGWPPGLLQDDDKKLSQWLASRPDARRIVRQVAHEIEAGHADFLTLVERQESADKESAERLEGALQEKASDKAAQRLGYEPFGYTERN